MTKQGALDYQDSQLINQLCDAVVPKLTENFKQRLTFNQDVVGSIRLRLTIAQLCPKLSRRL